MKKEIWKFELKTTDTQSIMMPRGSEILSVQTQMDIPYLYALVLSGEEDQEMMFEIFGTGNPVHCNCGMQRKYIGTYKLENTFVGHVFWRII